MLYVSPGKMPGVEEECNRTLAGIREPPGGSGGFPFCTSLTLPNSRRRGPESSSSGGGGRKMSPTMTFYGEVVMLYG